ncbi:PAS domain-containing protein [Sphingomonas sinipercae]|uniref:histidine kinase n=1 Tax=Sphingomonas sinipercae TaxID=2714944 RepID=A0A6G7ZPY9_9SPHN|nr:MASE1 domain-containing protein [Sphingomonas sinipercae]QIL02966.1 PAS domain-containing protein [Sphingomonas sinipercae]
MSSDSEAGLATEGLDPVRHSHWLFASVLIFLGYLVPAVMGSEWSLRTGVAPPIWPAAGIAVAGLSIAGLRFWPAVGLAMLATLQLTSNTHSFAADLALSLSKAAAAVAGATVLRRVSGAARPRLRQLRDLAALLAAGIAAALVSGLSAATIFTLEGAVPATFGGTLTFLLNWTLGDVLGILIFGAFVLAWEAGGQRLGRKDWVHLAAILAATALVTWLVYFAEARVRAFYLYPILIWAAFNLRTIGATSSLAVMAILAVAGTASGFGPFAQENPAAGMLLVQQFLAIAAAMTLFVAAVSEERRTRALNETERAEALAASRLAELNSLYESAPIGLAFFSRDYRYLRINQELAGINGIAAEAHIGRTIRDIVQVDAESVEQVIDRVFATGESVRDVEIKGETPLRPGVTRHWLTGFYPILDEAAEVQAVGIWVVEISERKAAEERERLLAREVDHRAKNLLAVVQSVVLLTKADTVESLQQGVVGRIQSLGRAHSLLAESRWEGVDLAQLVREEMAPFADSQAQQVETDGPSMLLKPAAAQSLALVLHELATNAAKYGALSVPSGRLTIRWGPTEPPEPVLQLLWEESAGPAVAVPTASGFGSRIIRTSIERQLRGTSETQWDPDGMKFAMRISLDVATRTAE